MVSNLHSEQLSAGLCCGQGSLLLAGPPPHYPQCHNGLASSRSKHMCFCLSVPTGGSWYDKWECFLYLRPQWPARHWVRVEYNIVLYRVHVPIIVKCQGNGCSLSSKDGAVIRESLGQLVAGRLTILEMAVYDHCCPNPLVNLRSISVDFIVWSLSIMILSEFGLSLFSSDHTFTPSLNEVEFLWIILMWPSWKAWCP